MALFFFSLQVSRIIGTPELLCQLFIKPSLFSCPYSHDLFVTSSMFSCFVLFLNREVNIMNLFSYFSLYDTYHHLHFSPFLPNMLLVKGSITSQCVRHITWQIFNDYFLLVISCLPWTRWNECRQLTLHPGGAYSRNPHFLDWVGFGSGIRQKHEGILIHCL